MINSEQIKIETEKFLESGGEIEKINSEKIIETRMRAAPIEKCLIKFEDFEDELLFED